MEGKEREKEMQTFTSGEDAAPPAYFIVERKACVLVCVRSRGEVAQPYAFSINHCVII